jgi:hypothetical protein
MVEVIFDLDSFPASYIRYMIFLAGGEAYDPCGKCGRGAAIKGGQSGNQSKVRYQN